MTHLIFRPQCYYPITSERISSNFPTKFTQLKKVSAIEKILCRAIVLRYGTAWVAHRCGIFLNSFTLTGLEPASGNGKMAGGNSPERINEIPYSMPSHPGHLHDTGGPTHRITHQRCQHALLLNPWLQL